MPLSIQQQQVSKGIIVGSIISFIVVSYGALANPFQLQEPMSLLARLEIYAYSMIFPTVSLILCVGLLAKHRFFTAEDISGRAYTPESEKARQLQSVLQNTLEQAGIVLSVYFLWCLIMPADYLSLVVLNSILFFIGRLLFIRGYSKGAGARSIGFSLTFYPSILTIGGIILYLFYRTLTQY